MNTKLEVIGIDHGWSMMKTVTQVFVTGVKEITTTPALFGDVLEYDGKYYKIGTVIPLLDHIIVGGDNRAFFSFKEKGMSDNPRITLSTDYRNLDIKSPLVAEQGKAR